MADTLANSTARERLLNSAPRPRPAKVHDPAHRKTEISEYRAGIGACIERARGLSGLTLEQFANEIHRDASQVGKWIRNNEPPQLDPILMSSLRGVMLQALFEDTPGCEVNTEIRVKRQA